MSKLDEHLKSRDKKERIGETGTKLFLIVMSFFIILIIVLFSLGI